MQCKIHSRAEKVQFTFVVESRLDSLFKCTAASPSTSCLNHATDTIEDVTIAQWIENNRMQTNYKEHPRLRYPLPTWGFYKDLVKALEILRGRNITKYERSENEMDVWWTHQRNFYFCWEGTFHKWASNITPESKRCCPRRLQMRCCQAGSIISMDRLFSQKITGIHTYNQLS